MQAHIEAPARAVVAVSEVADACNHGVRSVVRGRSSYDDWLEIVALELDGDPLVHDCQVSAFADGAVVGGAAPDMCELRRLDPAVRLRQAVMLRELRKIVAETVGTPLNAGGDGEIVDLGDGRTQKRTSDTNEEVDYFSPLRPMDA